MADLIQGHACGCPVDGDHKPRCVLAEAETIAAEAADYAAEHGGHELVAAIEALVEAGLLRNFRPTDADDIVTGILGGLLDDLYYCGLLVSPQSTVEQAEAASGTCVDKLRNLSTQRPELAALDELTDGLVERADAVVAQLDAVVNPTRRAA